MSTPMQVNRFIRCDHSANLTYTFGDRRSWKTETSIFSFYFKIDCVVQKFLLLSRIECYDEDSLW